MPAGLLLDQPVNPAAITAFARLVPPDPQYVLDTLLPVEFVPSNKIRWDATGNRTRRTARYRAPDARFHVSTRDAVSGGEVRLPALSTSFNTGEYEALQLELVRLGGNPNGAAAIDAIYDDATNGTREVQARLEQARGDVLVDGKFTLAGEGGMLLEADFGVPAANFTTAATVWTTTSAPILNDIQTIVNGYASRNGGRLPGYMHMSRSIYQSFLLNDQLRARSQSLTGLPELVTRAQVDNALSTFGLPAIGLVYDVEVDVDGVSTRVLPANKVIFTPSNPRDLGSTAMGVTATALRLLRSGAIQGGFSQAAGIVGAVVEEGPPYRQFVFIDACGMPVLKNPSLLAVHTVAA